MPTLSQESLNPRQAADSSKTSALAQLLGVIVASATERGHRPQDTARYLDVDPSHWYRLRRYPERLSKAEPALLQRVAHYIGWTHLDVCLATGQIDRADLWASPQTDATLRQALQQVSRSPFASILKRPLAEADQDLQILVARLYIATEAWAIDRSKAQD
jgi:hypothetical protein